MKETRVLVPWVVHGLLGFPLKSRYAYVSLHPSEIFGCVWMHASVDAGIRSANCSSLHLKD